jgi:hypothetical protein
MFLCALSSGQHSAIIDRCQCLHVIPLISAIPDPVTCAGKALGASTSIPGDDICAHPTTPTVIARDGSNDVPADDPKAPLTTLDPAVYQQRIKLWRLLLKVSAVAVPLYVNRSRISAAASNVQRRMRIDDDTALFLQWCASVCGVFGFSLWWDSLP